MEKGTLLVGEPMGLFIAEETGALEDINHFTMALAGADRFRRSVRSNSICFASLYQIPLSYLSAVSMENIRGTSRCIFGQTPFSYVI